MTRAGCGHCWARGGDAAGHHQDSAGVPSQVGSPPHTKPSSVALPAQPHTHSEAPATTNPSLPSLLQVCGEQKTDHRAARCPADLGTRLPAGQAAPQQGRWHSPVCYTDRTEHTCPWPQAVPQKLCHCTGQAQTSLSRERAQHIAQLVTAT